MSTTLKKMTLKKTTLMHEMRLKIAVEASGARLQNFETERDVALS